LRQFASLEADYLRSDMWIRIAGCLVIAACGYPPLPAHGGMDASLDGTAIDGAGDGSSAPSGCFQQWLDHTVSFTGSTIQEIMELSSTGNDRDPWISRDGLRLYFVRNPGSHGLGDIYLARRTSTEVGFAVPGDIANLNTVGQEQRAALTADERMLVLATDHGGVQGRLQIAIATRPDAVSPFGSPDQRHLASVNTDAFEHYDPFLTGDGLKLYLAPNSGVGGRQEIEVAVRPDLNSDFTTPTPVPQINSSNASSADPALSDDERVMVFSSIQSGDDVDLYYATRARATDDFGAPIKLPAVNSTAGEGDPVLAADGCELYFASNRRDGKYHLFHAPVSR
jgi:Tol biopolymer transport system component